MLVTLVTLLSPLLLIHATKSMLTMKRMWNREGSFRECECTDILCRINWFRYFPVTHALAYLLTWLMLMHVERDNLKSRIIEVQVPKRNWERVDLSIQFTLARYEFPTNMRNDRNGVWSAGEFSSIVLARHPFLTGQRFYDVSRSGGKGEMFVH